MFAWNLERDMLYGCARFVHTLCAAWMRFISSLFRMALQMVLGTIAVAGKACSMMVRALSAVVDRQVCNSICFIGIPSGALPDFLLLLCFEERSSG